MKPQFGEKILPKPLPQVKVHFGRDFPEISAEKLRPFHARETWSAELVLAQRRTFRRNDFRNLANKTNLGRHFPEISAEMAAPSRVASRRESPGVYCLRLMTPALDLGGNFPEKPAETSPRRQKDGLTFRHDFFMIAFVHSS